MENEIFRAGNYTAKVVRCNTAIVAAGQLATKVFSEHFGIKEKPEMGGYAEFQFEGRRLRLYRMPSSSRAYPMAVEKKAEFYRKMFDEIL